MSPTMRANKRDAFVDDFSLLGCFVSLSIEKVCRKRGTGEL
jgi:hypothetical protein